MHPKKFSDWNQLKTHLHFRDGIVPLAQEGEMWWASLGENIGYEMNGKSDLFSRPVIIVKKFAQGFYLVIPVTTQVHTGSWYVRFKQNQKEMDACLHQSRSMDYRRLSSKLGHLDRQDFRKIKEGFFKLCA